MAAKRRRRRGLILAGLAVLVALAAVTFLIARPARVVGVTEGPLSDSLESEADGGNVRCAEIEGGRPEQTVWRCAGRRDATLTVQADEWGCWEAEAVESRKRLSGCIWLGDYVPVIG